MVLRAQPVWPQEDVGGAMAIIEEDRQQRSTTDPQALLSRLRVQTSDEDLFLPHAGHLLGVQQAGGTSPLVVARVQQLREANQEWRLWQLQEVTPAS